MTDTESVYRCTICALEFPPDPKWQKCPRCGETTSPIQTGSANPISDRDATSMLRAREFQEYLEEEGIT